MTSNLSTKYRDAILLSISVLFPIMAMAMIIWFVDFYKVKEKSQPITNAVARTDIVMKCIQQSPVNDPCYEALLDKDSIDLETIKEHSTYIRSRLGFRAGSRLIKFSFDHKFDWKSGFNYLTFFTVAEYEKEAEVIERYKFRFDLSGGVKFMEISLHSEQLGLDLFLVQGKLKEINILELTPVKSDFI